MSIVYLSIGSNKGNRFVNITRCLLQINSIEKTLIRQISSFYETEPIGVIDQPNFINQVVEIETELNAYKLFDNLMRIEKTLGRISKGDKQPREIDIDILIYDQLIIDTETLTIPHKDMHNRRFVLEPLCEINQDLIHPVFKKTIKQLLSQLKDTHLINKLV